METVSLGVICAVRITFVRLIGGGCYWPAGRSGSKPSSHSSPMQSPAAAVTRWGYYYR